MSSRKKIYVTFLILAIGSTGIPVPGQDEPPRGVSAEDIEIVRNLDILEEMELLESLDLAENYETVNDTENSQIKGDGAHEENSN